MGRARIALAALVVAEAADLITTLAGLRHGSVELNALVLAAIALGGVLAFALGKASVVALAALALAYRPTRRAVASAVAVGAVITAAVAVWNAALVVA